MEPALRRAAVLHRRAYRQCLAPGETILPLPVNAAGDADLWQAVNGFRFAMAGGYVTEGPPAGFVTSNAVEWVALGNPVSAAQAQLLRDYIRDKHVTAVVVDPSQSRNWDGRARPDRDATRRRRRAPLPDRRIRVGLPRALIGLPGFDHPLLTGLFPNDASSFPARAIAPSARNGELGREQNQIDDRRGKAAHRPRGNVLELMRDQRRRTDRCRDRKQMQAAP